MIESAQSKGINASSCGRALTDINELIVSAFAYRGEAHWHWANQEWLG